jgi:hypothetical protein
MDMILEWDEFEIYSNKGEIEKYIESIFHGGIEDKDQIYTMCIEKFGNENTGIINELFNDDED